MAKIGYTAGAFDLFHIGHLNLLENSKKNCDYLIVGITTDELVKQTKGKYPIIPLEERIRIIEAIKYVDNVVIQDNLDKFAAWNNIHYDILFSGDDWASSSRWKGYVEKLNQVGVEVRFFPYTKSTSSTILSNFIKNNT